MAPIGIVMGRIIEQLGNKFVFETEGPMAVINGLSTGTFLYIVFFEIAPHEFLGEQKHRIIKATVMVIGILVIAASILSGSHGHTHGPVSAEGENGHGHSHDGPNAVIHEMKNVEELHCTSPGHCHSHDEGEEGEDEIKGIDDQVNSILNDLDGVEENKIEKEEKGHGHSHEGHGHTKWG